MIVAFIGALLATVLLSLGIGGVLSILALHIGFVPDLGYWEAVFLYLFAHLLLSPVSASSK